ncbi:hypothetical protein Hanom_Chr07g00638531 [Helianthus anomalus]
MFLLIILGLICVNVGLRFDLFQSPAFVNQLESFLAARGKQVAPDDEYDDDDLT